MFCGKWEKVHETATTPGISERDALYGASLVGMSPRLGLLAQAGLALSMMGRRAEGQRMWDPTAWGPFLERFPVLAMFGHFYDCHISILYGDAASAFAIARDMSSQIEKVQTNITRVAANIAMGEVYLAQGEGEKAAAPLEECLRIIDETHTVGSFRGMVLGYLCDANLAVGHIDEGRRCAEEAVEYCRSGELKWNQQPWLALARSSIRSGDQTAALEAIEETQQIIDETGAIVYTPFLHECRAEFARTFDCQRWSADDEMREAHRLFEDLGAAGHVERIAELLQ
jgi:tetratricopeptide (TPR) repeat protein